MKLMNTTKAAAGFFAHRSPAIKSLIIVALFLCAHSALRAQSVNATLTGTATDQAGANLPGVTVRITNPETGFQREAETNENGTFVLPALSPAVYTVSASKDGFAPAKFNNLTLNVNDQRSLRIELRVGDVNASVSVDADESALINESAAQATTIDRTFVGNLPLNGRSFQSLILLSPGVVPTRSDNAGSSGTPGQFSVNGQRNNANYFTVDGVSANVESNVNNGSNLVGAAANGSLPGFSALGTTNTLVSVDALEEFKIQTSTYSAEYGRQPGGQIQLVTRSGGGSFHGSIFDYVRNEVFDANNFFTNATPLTATQIARGLTKQTRPPLRQNDFGGTFSGPVFLPRFGEGGPLFYNGKNRTFFFFSYEGLRLRLPVIANTFVPSLRIRGLAAAVYQPILNAYPIPTGAELTNAAGVLTGTAPFQTAYSNPSSSDSYSIRLDHTLNKKITLFGRYNEAPSTNLTRTLNRLSGGRSNTRTLTLGTTFVPTSNFSNDFRFNYSQNRGRSGDSLDDFGGGVPIDVSVLTSGYSGPGPVRGTLINTGLPGVLGFGLGDAQDSYQRQINIVDNFSFLTGAHQLKFGADYRRIMPTFAPSPFSQGTSIGSLANLLSAQTSFIATNTRQGAEPRISNYSFYAQDTWKVNKRLTLDLGLRYELNPPPVDANGIKPVLVTGIVGTDVSRATLAPSGTPFYNTDKTAFAPRLGAVYQLNDKAGRETVLRGGFGVYYDLGNSTALNGFNTYPFIGGGGFFLGATFPLPPSAVVPQVLPAVTLPFPLTAYAIDPDLKLPYTLQFNFGVEQSLGKDQALSVSYVGSRAGRLITTQNLNSPPRSGQPRPNPNFSSGIVYTVNGATSSYDSLQSQFRRRLSSGLQVLVNYTWSHAIDDGSDELAAGLFDRGNSAFDVRHNFSAAFTYEIPTFSQNRFIRATLGGWSADSTIYLQSGQPINIVATSLTLPDGRIANIRPDLVSGVPIWIDAPVPGGRRINPAAFTQPPTCGTGCFVRQGTLGRNAVYGPGIFQVNFGLRREFKLTEQLRFNVGAEAFNLFNKPQFSSYNSFLSGGNFGIPTQTLNSSLGGLNALYQLGGPRSLQFSARLSF